MRKWFGCLLGIAIGAILVFGVIVPEMRTSWHRSRQKHTMADMRTISMALEAFATDRKSFAIGAREITALTPVSMNDVERALQPTYIKKVPRLDGWGNPFDVRVSTKSYVIRSTGSDGRFNASSYATGTIDSFADDVVFSDGNWIRYPEGL